MKTRILIVGTLLAILVAFAASGQPGAINATVVRHVNMLDSTKVLPINGSIYYNEQSHKFRAYQNNQWFDLINLGAGGGGGDISLGALNGASKTSSGAALVDDVLYMQTADATFPGLVSTGSQTFAGNKSFNAHVYPASDNGVDLGSTSLRWRSLYLSNNLGIGVTPSLKVHALGTTGGDLFYADANGQSFGGYRIRAGASGQQWAFRGGSTSMSLTDVTANVDVISINKPTPGTVASWFGGGSTKRGYLYTDNDGVGITSASGTAFTVGAYFGLTDLHLYTNAQRQVSITPLGALRMNSSLMDEKLSLWKGAGTYQFYGFGVVGNTLRYQISGTEASHIWYTSTGDYSAATEIARLRGTGAFTAQASISSPIILASGGDGYRVALNGTADGYIRGRNNALETKFDIQANGTSYFNGGNVGIGTTSPTHKLSIEGTGHVRNSIKSTTASAGIELIGNAHTWSIYTVGGGTDLAFWDTSQKFVFATTGIGTATNWVATSDIRLKNNIKYVGPQLDKVTKIAEVVRNYDRTDNGENETGFVAQELYEVAPEYVVKGNDSTMWAVNYQKMVVPLYKAVAELQEQINELREENALLRKQTLDRAGREAHRNRFTESFQEADGEFTRKMKALKKARR